MTQRTATENEAMVKSLTKGVLMEIHPWYEHQLKLV